MRESLEQLEKSLQKARTVSHQEQLQMLVWLLLEKRFAWVNCPSLEELCQLLALELDQLSPDIIASLIS